MRTLASFSRPMRSLVGLIFRLRHPRQVGEGRIILTPVQMRTLVFRRALTDKCLQHYQVDSNNAPSLAVFKTYGRIAAAQERLENSPPNAPYDPHIGHFVKPDKTFNVTPFFHKRRIAGLGTYVKGESLTPKGDAPNV